MSSTQDTKVPGNEESFAALKEMKEKQLIYTLGYLTSDPEVNEASRMFLHGLEYIWFSCLYNSEALQAAIKFAEAPQRSRRDDAFLYNGVYYITLAFLIDERSIRYTTIREVPANIQKFVLDHNILKTIICNCRDIIRCPELSSLSQGRIQLLEIILELLKIIPSICTGTHFNERLNQHWIGQAFRSIEILWQAIKNNPYLENMNDYGFLQGNMNRKKLLCLRGMCYEKIGNYEQAVNQNAKAIVIDSTYLPARENMAVLRHKYGSNKIKHSCRKCGNSEQKKLVRCACCESVSYCSEECKTADWEHHESLCNSFSYFVKVKAEHHGITLLQSRIRGMLARKSQFFRKFQIFYKKWKPCLVQGTCSNIIADNWSALKEKQAFICKQEFFDEDDLQETSDKLDDAMANAMPSGTEDQEYDLAIKHEEIDYGSGIANKHEKCKLRLIEEEKTIEFTHYVLKWLRTCDNKYKDFFFRRMKQLKYGHTSRILKKRLKGSTKKIYEVYLEQKSGFRILYTERGDHILIWYVAKHKNVSRLIKLIDDSKNRSGVNRVYIDDVEGLDDTDTSFTKNDAILLDPLGNVPMKRYEMKLDKNEEILTKEWTPSLVLTKEDQNIIETKGTVLLLGRSGTGKTICICSRMEYDRRMNKSCNDFSQLFVARSSSICRLVEGMIETRDRCKLVTFHDLQDLLENELPKFDSIPDDFVNQSEKQMNFFRFKREFFRKRIDEVDPLIVWTNIRSFIKGSIEATESEKGFISMEQYLGLERKRCRFNHAQRKEIYTIFQRYQDFLDTHKLWDENDRIIALLRRLKLAREADPDLSLGTSKCLNQFHKVYVDEVQDYTQVEILLFFVLGGAGNLFLAGDPAQNVARGVEFRFADIRKVGYYVAGYDEGKKELIPQKPKIMNINFRSHAGILQCAASILAEMFHHFPDSVKMLKKDAGLFQGPRPEVLADADASLLQGLIHSKLNGVVVLTHDENVEHVKKKLGGYELVHGIRHCKGLEFKSVIIMDFFSNISSDLQNPWKEMLLHRADNVYLKKFAEQFPEIEVQLKLLYTAITRCIERLFFVETVTSKAGDAFIRWSTTVSLNQSENDNNPGKAIATVSHCTNVESMSLNRDEWLASGLSNVEAADVEDFDLEHKKTLMEQAIYCFEQGRHDLLARKAKLQKITIEIRLKLYHADIDDIDQLDELETEAVSTIRELLEAGMSSEISQLGKDLRKIMSRLHPSFDFLQKCIIEKRIRHNVNRITS
ncbi:P-loop containing nucleoside triphosphate hydrolase protein [Chaetoceros tenuissimus]|uniref:P-loop containing nucleoside triphosphate hydrolase protein n=1 Tax=Chaetoceros tenuissimus TaxID=426638 RepID=A0AAD3CFR3_9STRA|nr:P-loop containing nucleoside triphosphate hydrolase protein [Chaetoceros tenuissimus]